MHHPTPATDPWCTPQVFVSKHLIPADMEFDAQSNPPSYVSQISEDQHNAVQDQ